MYWMKPLISGNCLRQLICHKFALDDINEAMETNIRMDGFKIAIVNN